MPRTSVDVDMKDSLVVLKLLLHLNLCSPLASFLSHTRTLNLRHSLFAESAITFAFANSFSSYLFSSFASSLILVG